MINAINERDPAHRRSLIEEAFTSDCAYTDPDDEVHGHDALDALFERLQHQAPPELRFSLLGPVDAHHQQARFTGSTGSPGRRSRWRPAGTSPSSTMAASATCTPSSTRLDPAYHRAAPEQTACSGAVPQLETCPRVRNRPQSACGHSP
ncbi:nuclear transport factor 2 family protein [Streptosporangium sp. NBC_01756]|uniref:nuclear transport factor 2 family protein n=1 Tax=Streptosporangium sp. NBC_01756 TaxID=2975950 RepID=UPI002DDC1494|nr:nuclear transport factor 2 family protein [Streptosporangium sp. NBC_01756]WSC86584.1 nuclear transport factor 2 family protein [Streptosporangium sp. NBC_01756]